MTSSLILPTGFSTHRHNGDPRCMHTRWWIGYHNKVKGETFVGCHDCSAATFIIDSEVMAAKSKADIKPDWDRLAKQMREADKQRILDRNGKKVRPANIYDKVHGLA